MGMVPKYPRIFGNRFQFILVPKYSTTPAPGQDPTDKARMERSTGTLETDALTTVPPRLWKDMRVLVWEE